MKPGCRTFAKEQNVPHFFTFCFSCSDLAYPICIYSFLHFLSMLFFFLHDSSQILLSLTIFHMPPLDSFLNLKFFIGYFLHLLSSSLAFFYRCREGITSSCVSVSMFSPPACTMTALCRKKGRHTTR